MKLVVFGLTMSSSWGNGHATLWRGLQAALAKRGWTVVFFERDVPYYRDTRDLTEIPGGELVLYPDWETAEPLAHRHLQDADAAMVTSYCPDGVAATELMLHATRPLRVFYDLDTPVTLADLKSGRPSSAIGQDGLSSFDLVLSYTGGPALHDLTERLGARRAEPLYGHVDPSIHAPAPRQAAFAADLSYIGTYASDRQAALEALFVEPARQRPAARFVIAGAQYPQDFPWTQNIHFVRHLPPAEHPAFYSSSRLTLNVTRAAMAAMGWCPSGRLFEAAACGTPVVTDVWPGLDAFFEFGTEILPVRDTGEALAALDRSDAELRAIGEAAQARVLRDHTSARRAEQLEALMAGAQRSATQPAALLQEA